MSLAVVPLLYVIYAFIATVYAYRYDLLPEYRKYTPLLVIWLLPSLGYSALKFGEAGMDVAKWVTIFCCNLPILQAMSDCPA